MAFFQSRLKLRRPRLCGELECREAAELERRRAIRRQRLENALQTLAGRLRCGVAAGGEVLLLGGIGIRVVEAAIGVEFEARLADDARRVVFVDDPSAVRGGAF